MLKEEASGGDGSTGGSNNNWARICDTCRSAPCTVYCHADSAYLCTDCDARIHAANQVASRHERVWICEACERMPAAFLCKADAASLCASCDADIHSANPLARRHHRVPIHPISGSGIYGGSGAHRGGGRSPGDAVDGYLGGEGDESFNEEDEDEAASWLLTNPVKNNQNNSGYLLGGDVDDYLNLVEYNSGVDGEFSEQYNQQQQYTVPQKSYGVHADSIVPVRSVEGKDQTQQQNMQTRMDYDTNSGYSYNASISQSVSVSSIDAGVVPESTTSNISHSRPPKGTIDLFQNPPVEMPTQLTPVDRVARVLRYREKKKNRKFEKTIRYASRKAYAETRPRIKGRFAKRTDVEVEMEQMFANNLIGDGGYGIVPSY